MHRNMQAVLYSKGTALRYTCNIKPFTAAHDVTGGPFDHWKGVWPNRQIGKQFRLMFGLTQSVQISLSEISIGVLNTKGRSGNKNQNWGTIHTICPFHSRIIIIYYVYCVSLNTHRDRGAINIHLKLRNRMLPMLTTA